MGMAKKSRLHQYDTGGFDVRVGDTNVAMSFSAFPMPDIRHR